MFRTSILVRFGDLDAAGIAYYPNLVNFLHVAFEDFFAGHVGRRYPEVFRDGIGFPTVKVEMEFLSPVRYGDHVDVDVTVERVGRSSVRIRYEGSVKGRPVFVARNTAVVVDLKTFRPKAVPKALRKRFEEAMEGARGGSRKAYERALRRVPDVPPEKRDKLPNKRRLTRSATAKRRDRRS